MRKNVVMSPLMLSFNILHSQHLLPQSFQISQRITRKNKDKELHIKKKITNSNFSCFTRIVSQEKERIFAKLILHQGIIQNCSKNRNLRWSSE